MRYLVLLMYGGVLQDYVVHTSREEAETLRSQTLGEDEDADVHIFCIPDEGHDIEWL